MEWLYSFYIGTSIFGIGVTIIDFLGFLGQHDSDSNGDGDIQADLEGDFDNSVDMDSSDDLSGNSDDGNINSHDQGSDDSDGESGSQNDHVHHSGHGALIQSHKKNNPILKLLSIMRYFVYFSMGFGPIGLISLATGSTFLASLFWSVPTGIIALLITSFIKKLQTRTLDSQIKESDLLMEPAEIIVPIEAGKMGKVRVLLGSSHVERYAKASDPKAAYSTGQLLRVTDIENEFVIVSDE